MISAVLSVHAIASMLDFLLQVGVRGKGIIFDLIVIIFERFFTCARDFHERIAHESCDESRLSRQTPMC